MELIWVAVIALLLVALTLIIGSAICFYMAFYEPRTKKNQSAKAILPPGELYAPFRETTRQWAEEMRAMDCEELYTRSFDGLQLYGRYFEYEKGAPIEIMFHGYRGSAERDLAGGVRRAFAVGHSVILVDQRTSGKSEGKVISFGINESRDCLTWVQKTIEHFGSDVKIILTGISMGAATVLIAAGQPLPSNVVGVLADCGYTSAKEIIQKTIHDMKLPARPLYPLVRLGAKLFGGFDPDEFSPIQAVKNCKVPVIFFHGDADDYVPAEMSQRNYDACASKKKLHFIKGAGHGLSYPVSPEEYVSAMKEFFYN